MKSKPVKIPFWKAMVQCGLVGMLVSFFLLPPSMLMFSMPFWLLLFYVCGALVLVGISFGIVALVARYKSQSSAAPSAEPEAAPSTPV